MRRRIVLAAVLTLGIACTPSTGRTAAHPAEDDPSFDCTRDGNGVCGDWSDDGDGTAPYRVCFRLPDGVHRQYVPCP